MKLNENYLNIPSAKIKEEDTINSRPLKVGNLGENSQLWYWKYTCLNYNRATWEIKVEKQLNIPAYLCKVGVETIVWKEIKIMSTNSAANYHENRFSRKTINTYITQNFTSNGEPK